MANGLINWIFKVGRVIGNLLSSGRGQGRAGEWQLRFVQVGINLLPWCLGEGIPREAWDEFFSRGR